MRVKKICCIFAGLVALMLMACDLQPRIMSLPDSVGDFISARYPALLADPDAQPEIYNSAATDYGVYASPELYGTTTTDDYVLYASVDDYIIPPQNADIEPDVGADVTTHDDVPASVSAEYTYMAPDAERDFVAVAPARNDDGPMYDNTPTRDDYLNVPMYGGAARPASITVARGDTLYSIAHKYNMTPDELAAANNLSAPYTLRVGQSLRIAAPAEKVQEAPKTVNVDPKPVKPAAQPNAEKAVAQGVKTTTRVDLAEITVQPGDTLYSVSRKYSTPVNDLAVMNNLTAPFSLSAGQRLKVPNLSAAPVRTATQGASHATTAPVAKAGAAKNAATAAQATVPAQKAPVAKNVSVSNKPVTNTPAAKKDAATSSKTQAPVKKDQNVSQKTQTQKISSDPKKKLPTIAARSSSKFSWPVRGTVLSHYGAKSGGLFNDGINIGAARGTSVKAAENGVVAYAGNEVKGMGNLIILQHSDGWMTVYAHMDSMAVRRGTRVAVGQKIGTVGETGKVDKPQLHFEIRKGTKAYNPSQYLKK